MTEYAIVHLIPVFESSGHWCDSCLLPSQVIFSIRGLSEFRGTPSVSEIGKLGMCEYCHNPSSRAKEFIKAVEQSHHELNELYNWVELPEDPS